MTAVTQGGAARRSSPSRTQTATDAVASPSALDRAQRAAARVARRVRSPRSCCSAIVMLLKGVNPITAYVDMVTSTFSSRDAVGDILVRSTPIMLAGLAVAVPARAGLINVGGEGQLIIGGICALRHVDADRRRPAGRR